MEDTPNPFKGKAEAKNEDNDGETEVGENDYDI